MLPTTGTIYTLAEVDNDPINLNSNLGLYTHFVNLMDLQRSRCPPASVPTGCRSACLSWVRHSPTSAPCCGAPFAERAATPSDVAPGCMLLCVVGAHLRGQPLNEQLTSRGARFVRSCRTAREYRLFALQAPCRPSLGCCAIPALPGRASTWNCGRCRTPGRRIRCCGTTTVDDRQHRPGGRRLREGLPV